MYIYKQGKRERERERGFLNPAKASFPEGIEVSVQLSPTYHAIWFGLVGDPIGS